MPDLDTSAFDDVTLHASSNGSPFGSVLCGFTPVEGGSVWVMGVDSAVTCAVCRDLLATQGSIPPVDYPDGGDSDV